MRRALEQSPLAAYFTARTFAHLTKDKQGLVSVLDLFNLILRTASLTNANIQIQSYSQSIPGFLSESVNAA